MIGSAWEKVLVRSEAWQVFDGFHCYLRKWNDLWVIILGPRNLEVRGFSVDANFAPLSLEDFTAPHGGSPTQHDIAVQFWIGLALVKKPPKLIRCDQSFSALRVHLRNERHGVEVETPGLDCVAKDSVDHCTV